MSVIPSSSSQVSDLSSFTQSKDELSIAVRVVLSDNRLVLPSALQNINVSHTTGIVKAKQRIREKAWIPGERDRPSLKSMSGINL